MPGDRKNLNAQRVQKNSNGLMPREELLDYDFMLSVESMYLSTRGECTGEYSLNKTAEAMEITRSKVRKILITLGTIESSLPENVRDMLETGEPLKRIASALGCSIANVSINAPYRTVLHNSAIKTTGGLRTRRYRERIKLRQETTITRGKFPLTDQRQGVRPKDRSSATVNAEEDEYHERR